MKIYTKTGDQGETGLIGNERVPKDHFRIESYGAVDELNAALGAVTAREDLPKTLRESLVRIQNELFHVGAELATPEGKEPPADLVGNVHIETLEKEVDEMEKDLPPTKKFYFTWWRNVRSPLTFSSYHLPAGRAPSGFIISS